jgi:hypothetical protein
LIRIFLVLDFTLYSNLYMVTVSYVLILPKADGCMLKVVRFIDGVWVFEIKVS